MKKIRSLFISFVAIFFLPLSVHAASGKIAVSSGSQVVVGNNLTVTVTLSSNTKIGSWKMNLNYDKSYLQLISSTGEAGGTGMVNSSTGTTKKTYTFTFKTLKTGGTKVSVDSYEAYAYDDMSEMSLTSSSKSVKIITQAELEASYSKVNDLASLSVEGFELTPSFDKGTLEYSVVVPEDTKEVNISAKAQDAKASVSGTGTKEVTSGTNSFEIIVRAENGAEKIYKVIVEVKDANPINVSVDGNSYTVVKIKDNLPTANAYQETSIKINDIDIPAFKSSNTGFILVGLKDSAGEIGLFIYDPDSGDYRAYKELGLNKVTFYPLDTDEKIDGYTKDEVEIDGVKVNGYYYEKDSRYVIIYGINVETGEKGFYMYDKESQAFVHYNDEYIKELQGDIKLYSYIIIGFSVIFVLFLLILIFRKPKRKKKKQSKQIEETIASNIDEVKDNDIVEIESLEEEKVSYEDKKGKKKKKDKKKK